METKTKVKHNRKIKNVKRGAVIKYQLMIKGYALNDIAADLNITAAAVSRSIYGLATVSRVDDWIRENLGLEV